mmetsp:Transcript_18415/g.33330  ORF Transcript_18415/g.33330 Transcript_18415/m.33330 type:complete len:138 (+) Transcript_18415:726-1139(+)
MNMRRHEVLPDNMGIRVKVKVAKNKVAALFKVIEFDILFGEGIDKMGCLLDAALDLGVVQQKGSWYLYQDSNFSQGRFNVGIYLKANRAAMKQMEEDVREALLLAKMPASDVNVEDESAVDDDMASPIVSEETSVLE